MMNLEMKSMEKKSTISPLTPGVFLLATSFLCFISWVYGEQVSSNFGIYGWRFTFTYMIKCQGLILVLYVGYLVGKSQMLANKKLKPRKSAGWDFIEVYQLGKRITFIGIISHLIWFFYSFLIVGTEVGKKLSTIPGLTTLTQVLPVGIACMYLANRKIRSLHWKKWLGISIFVVGLRSILNSERLALLELLIPLITIYMFFEKSKKLKQKLMLSGGASLGAYSLFFLFEYWRSWRFYKFRWDGSYLSFINERIGLYYMTSWNNGVVYSQYWQDVGNAGRAFFAFITEFPLFQGLFGSELARGTSFGNWFGTLNSTVGTAEFNNSNYLIVSFTDLTYAGAIFWFALIGIITGKMFKEVQRGNLMALLAYACTIIAFADLPRVGWWTATRSIPVYIALIVVYFSKLDKDQSGSTKIE